VWKCLILSAIFSVRGVGEKTVTEVKSKPNKILVVEDDEASSAIIVRLLNQMGFSKIIQAKNGNIALSKLYLN
jgi:hypothetical protein